MMVSKHWFAFFLVISSAQAFVIPSQQAVSTIIPCRRTITSLKAKNPLVGDGNDNFLQRAVRQATSLISKFDQIGAAESQVKYTPRDNKLQDHEHHVEVQYNPAENVLQRAVRQLIYLNNQVDRAEESLKEKERNYMKDTSRLAHRLSLIMEGGVVKNKATDPAKEGITVTRVTPPGRRERYLFNQKTKVQALEERLNMYQLQEAQSLQEQAQLKGEIAILQGQLARTENAFKKEQEIRKALDISLEAAQALESQETENLQEQARLKGEIAILQGQLTRTENAFKKEQERRKSLDATLEAARALEDQEHADDEAQEEQARLRAEIAILQGQLVRIQNAHEQEKKNWRSLDGTVEAAIALEEEETEFLQEQARLKAEIAILQGQLARIQNQSLLQEEQDKQKLQNKENEAIEKEAQLKGEVAILQGQLARSRNAFKKEEDTRKILDAALDAIQQGDAALKAAAETEPNLTTQQKQDLEEQKLKTVGLRKQVDNLYQERIQREKVLTSQEKLIKALQKQLEELQGSSDTADSSGASAQISGKAQNIEVPSFFFTDVSSPTQETQKKAESLAETNNAQSFWFTSPAGAKARNGKVINVSTEITSTSGSSGNSGTVAVNGDIMKKANGNSETKLQTVTIEGSVNGDKVNGSVNGNKVNGFANGDKTNGLINGDNVNGPVNGDKVNGSVNGDKANGPVNGDKVNGPVNGNKVNGSVNGNKVNGSGLAPEAPKFPPPMNFL